MNPLKHLSFSTVLIALVYFSIYNQEFKEIAAGMAIFLFGILFMEQTFKDLDSLWFQKKLRSASKNITNGLIFGTLSTAIIQSGALTTLLTISFVSVGLIPLVNSIGLIAGANIGATITPWVVSIIGDSFNITEQSYFVIIIGAFFYIQKKKNYKIIGGITIAIGFIFLGIGELKSGFSHASESVDFSDFHLGGSLGVIIYFIIGMIITFLIFSSNAMALIVMVAFYLGHIDLSNAVAIIIGANVGSSITPLLSTIGGSYQGKRVSFIHFSFNLTATLIFITPLLIYNDFYKVIINYLNIPREFVIPFIHTIFNISGAILLIIFRDKVVDISTRTIKEPSKFKVKPKFISKQSLKEESLFYISLNKEIKDIFLSTQGIFLKNIRSKINEHNEPYIEFDQFTKPTTKLYKKTVYPIILKINEYSFTAKEEFDSFRRKKLEDIIGIMSVFDELNHDIDDIGERLNKILREEHKEANKIFKGYLYKNIISMSSILNNDDLSNEEKIQMSNDLRESLKDEYNSINNTLKFLKEISNKHNNMEMVLINSSIYKFLSKNNKLIKEIIKNEDSLESKKNEDK